MQTIGIILCCAFAFFVAAPVLAGEPPMRGVVLSVQDLETVDWPELAHENGINTIGTHIFPEQVAAFIESEKGRRFLADCKKYDIKVEHQLHAIGQLLPRESFADDPTMFRMDENGERVNDCNLCVHSTKALDKVAEKAVHYAKLLPTTNHRYYYWIDDGMPICKCPECSKLSDSEQALILENRIIKELRKCDPEALLAHLAYHNTMSAPRRVKPEEGIFLQYAPIHRTWDKPIDASHLRELKENLTVFPVETAEVLEYWLDVSLFSKWKKPAVKLPWNREVFESDLDTYAALGIRNITSFAVYIDDKYIETYKDLGFLKEYGDGLKKLSNKKTTTKKMPDQYTVTVVSDGLIHPDGENTEPEWGNASRLSTFSNPWNAAVNPATGVTFLQDSRYLYFYFEADDTDLVIESAITDECNVAKEDRVELFFSKDREMNEYYCFEMDPANRVLSYRGQYYREFQFDWEPPSGFMTAARLRPGDYSVKGAIPLGFLDALRNEDGSVYFGAYRAEFSKKEDGSTVENWLTWVDPETASPDFHVPQSLGIMILPKHN